MPDDYPAHLNPFKRSALRESFRTIRSAFRKTFRRKRSVDKSSTTSLSSSSTFPASNSIDTVYLRNDPPPVLRNIERAKTHDGFPQKLNRAAKAATYTPGTVPLNPFDEEDVVNPVAKPPRATNGGSTGRRRKKKRAPLPPGMLGNRLTVPEHHDSKWSLTSCGTEYSCNYSEDIELEDNNGNDQLKDIQEISNKIQNFCADDREVDDKRNVSPIAEEAAKPKDGTDAQVIDAQEETKQNDPNLEENNSGQINRNSLETYKGDNIDDQNNNCENGTFSTNCDKLMNHADKDAIYSQGDVSSINENCHSGPEEDLPDGDCEEKPTPRIRKFKPTKQELLGDYTK